MVNSRGWDYNEKIAGVAQWQSRSFPSLRRGFDSRPPLHIFFRLLSFPFAYLKKKSATCSIFAIKSFRVLSRKFVPNNKQIENIFCYLKNVYYSGG